MIFELHQSFPDHLEKEWNNLLADSIVHVPFLRYEYLKSWWQTRGGGEWGPDARLAIVTASQSGRLVGVAPLFIADWEERPTLLLLGSIEISDFLDLIVRAEDLPAFCLGLLDVLTAAQFPLPWACLDLYNVLDSSPALAALQQAAARCGLAYALEPFRPSVAIRLSGDWETYLAGIDKKQRHEIRRKMRRAYAGELPVRWYIVQEADELEPAISEFLRLMTLDAEKARFLTPPMRENFVQTMRCAFTAGCLQLAFLEIGGVKAAGYFNLDYLNQVWVYNSGMDPSFNEYSPGWVLLGELLRWANENGRDTFDFMRGDEDYKFRFGGQQRAVMRVTLTRPDGSH